MVTEPKLMYGNCLIFALIEFIKYGGGLYIEFWPNRYVPHFSVQRNDIVYDFDARRCILYVFWSVGKRRQWTLPELKKFKCKRILLFKRAIINLG